MSKKTQEFVTSLVFISMFCMLVTIGCFILYIKNDLPIPLVVIIPLWTWFVGCVMVYPNTKNNKKGAIEMTENIKLIQSSGDPDVTYLSLFDDTIRLIFKENKCEGWYKP